MPAKLKSDEDGKHIVIRPLAYCREDDLAAYALKRWRSPLSPATSVALRRICSGSGRSSRCCEHGNGNIRVALRRYSVRWGNVAPSHLLDRDLFNLRDFQGQVGDGAELPDIRVVNL